MRNLRSISIYDSLVYSLVYDKILETKGQITFWLFEIRSHKNFLRKKSSHLKSETLVIKGETEQMFKDKIRLVGLLMICFSLIYLGRMLFRDIQIIGLTPENCTKEVEGVVVDSVPGAKSQYGGNRGHMYSVYYDVIEYKVKNKKYKITSRHAQTSKTVIGAMTTVHYNPSNPAKAYDNSPPQFEGLMYFYPAMIFLIGLFLIFRLDLKLKRN